MARDLDGSTGYLGASASPVSGAPLTLFCRFNPDVVNTFLCAFSLSQNASPFRYVSLSLNNNAPYAEVYDGTNVDAPSPATTVSAGTWNTMALVVNSATSRTAYCNGVAASGTSTSINPTSTDLVRVGILPFGGTPFYFWNGKLADVAVWDVALTADEVASLERGASPSMVRPESLVGYWPLIGRYSPEIDLTGVVGGLSVTGTAVVADHPRVYLPAGQTIVPASDAASSDAVGASVGTSTVTGIGASTAETVGAVASVATLSGAGAATTEAAGATAGVATVTDVGASTAEAVGTAAGIAATAGAGASTAEAAGTVTGAATAAGAGTATAEAAGTAAGVAAVAGVSAATAEAVGTAAGTAVATGVGEAVGEVEAAGSAAGTATVAGVGAATAEAAGIAAGTSTAIGIASAPAPEPGGGDDDDVFIGVPERPARPPRSKSLPPVREPVLYDHVATGALPTLVGEASVAYRKAPGPPPVRPSRVYEHRAAPVVPARLCGSAACSFVRCDDEDVALLLYHLGQATDVLLLEAL